MRKRTLLSTIALLGALALPFGCNNTQAKRAESFANGDGTQGVIVYDNDSTYSIYTDLDGNGYINAKEQVSHTKSGTEKRLEKVFKDSVVSIDKLKNIYNIK
ncbi:MAG: hypothetical protein AABW63_01755 [Nanoarchaeota archaeon]